FAGRSDRGELEPRDRRIGVLGGLDPIGLCEGRLGEFMGPDPSMQLAVSRDAVRPPAEQRVCSVRVSPQVVHVPGAELRETLEELGVVGPLRLLPGCLPGLVGGEEPAGVQMCDAQPVVLLRGQRVVVLEVELVLGLVRERPPQFVPRTLRLGWGIGVSRPPGFGCRRALNHEVMLPAGRPQPLLLPRATRGSPRRTASAPIQAQNEWPVMKLPLSRSKPWRIHTMPTATRIRPETIATSLTPIARPPPRAAGWTRGSGSDAP